LFTVEEETGLVGAQRLDGSIVSGRVLINLDSEEDGRLFVGCAGGTECRLVLPVDDEAAAPGSAAVAVAIRGLVGGHSGLEIHHNRGNSLKLMTRCLAALADAGLGPRLAALEGGSKHNAIPRESDAVLVLEANRRPELARVVARVQDELCRELGSGDDRLSIAVEPVPAFSGRAWTARDTGRVLDLLAVLPSGVLGMSAAVPGLVETSCNLAVVRQQGGQVLVTLSARSSVDSRMRAVVESIRAAARLAGATAEVANSYPGWQPDLQSRALAAVRRAWTELYGPPELAAVHAGLECGLLGQRVPGLDMVSFGPQIEGAHSPDERVRVASVERFWHALARSLDLLGTA
jgi:dipeptidase D